MRCSWMAGCAEVLDPTSFASECSPASDYRIRGIVVSGAGTGYDRLCDYLFSMVRPGRGKCKESAVYTNMVTFSVSDSDQCCNVDLIFCCVTFCVSCITWPVDSGSDDLLSDYASCICISCSAVQTETERVFRTIKFSDNRWKHRFCCCDIMHYKGKNQLRNIRYNRFV